MIIFLILLPIMILVIWGVINPNKPILPTIPTEDPLIIAAAIKAINLVFLESTPKFFEI